MRKGVEFVGSLAIEGAKAVTNSAVAIFRSIPDTQPTEMLPPPQMAQAFQPPLFQTTSMFAQAPPSQPHMPGGTMSTFPGFSPSPYASGYPTLQPPLNISSWGQREVVSSLPPTAHTPGWLSQQLHQAPSTSPQEEAMIQEYRRKAQAKTRWRLATTGAQDVC